MKSSVIFKFCCCLVLAVEINGEFSDPAEGAVRAGKRRLAAEQLVRHAPAERSQRQRQPDHLRQAELREARRQQRRHRAEARRTVRERNKRQRVELRQHRQRPPSSDAPVAENGTRKNDLAWFRANLSSLWEAVRTLQNNQATLLQASGLSHLNATRRAPELSTAPPGCPAADDSECPADTASCTAEPGAASCSGRGLCCCGSCLCGAHYYGAFCECSDLSCPWHDGQRCGGAGTCTCGRCACDAGHTGEACECTLEDAACRGHDGVLCSKHGVCECGRCRCHESHKGALCEASLYSAGLCEQLKPCVLCRALGRALPQCRLCDNVTVQLSSDLEPSQNLCRMVHSGCLLQYSYEAADDGSYVVAAPARLIEDFKNC